MPFIPQQQAMYQQNYYNQPYGVYPQHQMGYPQPYYNGAAMGPNQYNPYAMNAYGGRGANMGGYPAQHGYPMPHTPVVASSPMYGPAGMNTMGHPHPQSPAVVSSPYGPPPSILPGTPSSTHSSYIQPVPVVPAPLQQQQHNGQHGPALSINVPPPMMATHDASGNYVLPTPVATSTISVQAKEFIPMSATIAANRPRADSELSEGAQFLKDFNSRITHNESTGLYEVVMDKGIITLPWFSRPDEVWPERVKKPKKKRVLSSNDSLKFYPIKPPSEEVVAPEPIAEQVEETIKEDTAARPETPSTTQPPSQAQSEHAASTTPTTPTSAQPPAEASQSVTPTSGKIAPKAIAIPLIPALPKKAAQAAAVAAVAAAATKKEPVESKAVAENKVEVAPAFEKKAEPQEPVKEDTTKVEAVETPAEPVKPVEEAKPAWSAPKSWAALLKPTATATPQPQAKAAPTAPAVKKTQAETLVDAFVSFDPKAKDTLIPFLEPRGLVNTGNMCYMNSVLQVLVFCIPFYDFLDQVGKKAVHNFKSDTPLIDAMIMFMREFPTLDSATTSEDLQKKIKTSQLEKFGDAFTPDFVYDVIRTLPRFASMRRGHQQDAEEFLGFLLEGLHDECVSVMKAAADAAAKTAASSEETNGWLEVGAKQKASTTQTVGNKFDSPITKIFGGTLKSVLKVSGAKDSITMEPYQPLQLDIHLPEVHTIIDALKGLARPETIHGDFNSPRGSKSATKQLTIETLPPVLILHLKRFQYDNSGGTQKIWKKVGYPLELELPKEVFTASKHKALIAHEGGLPKYKLTSVVYHHGKNATTGHYTVDVRRQDGREWIRLDDTVIRRVRAEDVAEGGSEDDAKAIARAMADQSGDSFGSNAFGQLDEDNGDEWKQVNGNAKKGEKKKEVKEVTRKEPERERFDVHDNKVAYLLFYQRME